MQEQPVETTFFSLAAKPPPRPERRSKERHLSLLRVGALEVEGRRELCLIRNVSGGGMMIRAYSPVAPGTRVSIELKQGNAVRGAVQWAEEGLTGVAFDAPIDVVALIAPANEGPQPRMPRVEIDCTAWLREGSTVHRTRALNISQGGLCVTGVETLPTGADVVVSLTGLAPAAGVVKWNEGGSYGIGFNRVLPLPELVPWLHEQQQRQRHHSPAAG